jgi:serine/threonine-protein kinase RsbW
VHYAADQRVTDPPLEDLRLAASEALTNCVLHAFLDREPGTITASLRVGAASGELELVVADDGSGMAPRTDSPGLGLGLGLISRITERVSVGVPLSGKGTELRMTFPCGRP